MEISDSEKHGLADFVPYIQDTEVGYFFADPLGTLITMQTATVHILEIKINTLESFRTSPCVQSNGHC